ncbi:MAG: bifunctional aminotransferase class I/II-fold pyridoxal phosphate-dependent enzyme/GNAT family N-acetyltransferase, partial [Candidatus Kapaibacterium sp.]
GCSGSRYLTGTVRLHEEMEAEMAAFMGKEACLLFSTGYQTAQGVIPTLVNRGDYVISDKDNHACIVAGNLMAKGAFGDVARYKHNDMADLERQLSRLPENSGKLIVTDGVFSTSGELVELPRMIELAKQYGARVMVDDAHGLGVIGVGGRGTASHYGLDAETDMTMGTFSKSLASLGGWVVGEERVINFIKHTSPALIFSASPTPASVAAALTALRIMRNEPERIDRLIANADYLRDGFTSMGFEIIRSQTGIVPVIIGDDTLTFIFWRRLFDAGVFVNAFISPGVMPGMQMMRTSVMATHEKGHLDRILELFEDIGTEMGLLEKDTPATAAEQFEDVIGAEGMSEFTEEIGVAVPTVLPTTGTVRIRPAVTRKERLEFIRMPWELYKNDPNWVAPLEMDRMRLIDTEKNPFYKHAHLALFIAERNGKAVGRIGAIINDSHTAIHNDHTGFFGFFESINDQDVANTLLNEASAWLREQGMSVMRGPISPSMNDEIGLLVNGFDMPAMIQMPYNHQYYMELFERAGLAKATDLLAWKVVYPECMTDKLRRVTDILKQRGKANIRPLSMKRFPEEVDRIKRIYNEAWQPNWGFVPMTDEEMNLMAYELKQIIDPEFVLFAEKDGETVGFALAVPDINQAFKAGSAIPPGAKNLPTAIMNLMTKKKQIKQVRIITLGVLPKYQGQGIDALLYREIMERAVKKGINVGEASWVLEDNTMMNRAAEMMQASPYKRYRIYQKDITV